ncbi:MAG: hypothetical protein IKO38_07040 [Erysipelotrichaceae bacterium]|nr:hypothetical protein [Erysipelotrichaceae bacterium]
MEISQVITSLIMGLIASSGFWAFIQSRTGNKSIQTQMLIGLGHDRIVYLGMKYIERGWVTKDELENLVDYLYKPYESMGGNGTAKKIVDDVKKLPMRSITPRSRSEEVEVA